jgi:hypothetical protein
VAYDAGFPKGNATSWPVPWRPLGTRAAVFAATILTEILDALAFHAARCLTSRRRVALVVGLMRLRERARKKKH